MFNVGAGARNSDSATPSMPNAYYQGRASTHTHTPHDGYTAARSHHHFGINGVDSCSGSSGIGGYYQEKQDAAKNSMHASYTREGGHGQADNLGMMMQYARLQERHAQLEAKHAQVSILCIHVCITTCQFSLLFARVRTAKIFLRLCLRLCPYCLPLES